MTTQVDMEAPVEEQVQYDNQVEATLLPYEEGVVAIYTGVKGSGKTNNLSRIAMFFLSCSNKKVYANFAIGGKIMGRYYEVLPLPDNFFVTYGRGVESRSVVIVTELGEYFNNQDWQRLQSKMGVSMFAQIRKLNITIAGDTQFFHHLNPRLAEQVDVLVRCKDLYKDPWGKDHKIGKGEESVLEYYDLSGDIAPDGKSARSEFNFQIISGKPYKREVVYTKAYWEYHDSHKLVALDQRFKKFYIEKEKIKVSPLEMSAVDHPSNTRRLRDFLSEIFNSAAQSGITEMVGRNIKDMLYADGFDVGDKEFGLALHNLGIRGIYRKSGEEGPGTYYKVKEIGKP